MHRTDQEKRVAVMLAFFGLPIAVVLILASVSTAAASPQTPTPRGVTSSPSRVTTDRQRNAVLDYWTPARLRSATPAPEPLTTPTPGIVTAPAPSSGVPQSAPPTLPISLGSPKDDYYISNSTSFPARVNGKLMFTAGNGQGYACTASVITAAGRSLIMTAGHCVFNADTGGWASNWMFIPAYDEGAQPFGHWVGHNAYAPHAWIENSNDFTYDVAAIPLLPNSNGQRVQDDVGAWGYTFSTNANQYHQQIGYPGSPSPPYDGGRMVGCDTSFDFFEAAYTTASDGSMAVQPCSQGHGASGGPYVTTDGKVQAVDSHGYCEVNGTFCGDDFGTYFGVAAQNLYNATANLAPTPIQTPTPTPTHISPSVPQKPAWCTGLRHKLKHRRLSSKARRHLARIYRRQCN